MIPTWKMDHQPTTTSSQQSHFQKVSSATWHTTSCGRIIILGEEVVVMKVPMNVNKNQNQLHVIFRALNKKLRAEELLKLSKLPPSMAKREEVTKKKEALDELETRRKLAELDESHAEPLTKHNVEFLPQQQKKKKSRKKVRKSKSAIGPSRNQFSRSYVFDSKRDKDRSSVKVNK